MSSALNGSSVLECFKCSNTIEIRNGITFDFNQDYHMCLNHNVVFQPTYYWVGLTYAT